MVRAVARGGRWPGFTRALPRLRAKRSPAPGRPAPARLRRRRRISAALDALTRAHAGGRRAAPRISGRGARLCRMRAGHARASAPGLSALPRDHARMGQYATRPGSLAVLRQRGARELRAVATGAGGAGTPVGARGRSVDLRERVERVGRRLPPRARPAVRPRVPRGDGTRAWLMR